MLHARKQSCGRSLAGRRALALAALLGAMGSPLIAAGQQQAIPLNRFQPAPAGDRFYAVPSPYAGNHLVPHAMALLEYAHQPLVLERVDAAGNGEYVGSIVRHHEMLHLNFGLGLFERMALNLDVPVALAQHGDFGSQSPTGYRSPSSSEFGDLRVGMRLRLFGKQSAGFQLGMGGYLWIPASQADEDSFLSDGTVRGMPQILLGGDVRRFIWSFATGPEVRDPRQFGGVPQGSMWIWGAGVGVLAGAEKNWQFGGETTVSIDMSDPMADNTNAEGLLSARWHAVDFLETGVGVGTGFTSGIGTPDFRAVMSLAYSPMYESTIDRDGDRIADDDDACPNEAGPRHDDPKKHGCPDRDGDDVLDKRDACPDLPGSSDPDPARHGCPTDRDGDGIPDGVDACPDRRGLPSMDPAKNGCPMAPADGDGDGILDPEDACPERPGPASSDAGKHGCPPDRDRDGIIDVEDGCPEVPGFPNGDPKLNGCPPDRDGDGILDREDGCPEIKGIRQDDPAKNGCPLVQITDKAVVIHEKVQFELNKAVVLPASDPLLDEVARVLAEHGELKRIEVQGHTDNTGPKWHNTRLSKRRANAVKEALTKRGVAAARLSTKGYGPSLPVASNNTAEGRAKNRRVAFKILERAPE